MCSISDLNEYKLFFDDIMSFLPENENNSLSNVDNEEQTKTDNSKIIEQKPRPKTPNKIKSKPKKPTIRPGFEGPKIIRKKRDE